MSQKENAIKLAIAFLTLTGFAACSSSDDNGTEPVNPATPTEIGGLGLIENNIQGRVINLLSGNNAAKAFTRATAADAPALTFAMPDIPASLESKAFNDGGAATTLTDDACMQTNHTAVTTSLNLNGHSILVKSQLTLTGITGPGNIYVNGTQKAQLILQTGTIPEGVNIYIYQTGDKKTGALKLDGVTNLTIAANAGLYTASNSYALDLPGATLTNNGKLYIGASQDGLRVASATLGAGSETYVKDNFRVENAEDVYGNLSVAGQLTVGRTLWAEDITVNNGVVVNSGKINANGNMTVSGANAKVYANYLKVGELDSKGSNVKTTLTQNSASQIILGNNGFIAAYNYVNNDNGNAFIDLADAGKAVLRVVNLTWNSGEPQFIHTSGNTTANAALFGVHFVNAYVGSTEQDWDDLGFDGGNVRKIRKETEFADFSIPADKTIDFNGYNPNAEGDGTSLNYKVLRVVAEVTYGDNADGLSATCAQADGDRVYVSYHTRGNSQAGRLEVLSTDASGNTQLLQSVSATGRNNAIDWNHIALDKTRNRLVGVGNSLKGGLLTTIDLKSDGTFNTTATTVSDSTIEPLRYATLQKVLNSNGNNIGDGNAVIVNNGYYEVASTYGTETFDAASLQGAYTHGFGRGKHIAQGNGQVAVAALNSVPTSTDQHVGMTVYLYPETQYRLDSPSSQFSVGDIYPNNGKNVIAIDGSDVYVCTSTEGLKVYRDGALSWSFKPADATYTVNEQQEGEKYAVGTVVARGLCNGVYVGSQYVYVAYGSLGVIVVDKTTHKEVARYAAGRSANFVTVTDNGYIYVAYGRNRLKVLQLEDRQY